MVALKALEQGLRLGLSKIYALFLSGPAGTVDAPLEPADPASPGSATGGSGVS